MVDSGVAHEIVAGRLYRPALAAARRCRSSQRTAYLEYRSGLHFRAASQDWGTERRLNWQLAELRRTVRYAYATTPFYRERLDAIGFDPRDEFGFDTYSSLPVLEREEVRAAGERMLSNAVPRALLREDATGGSSGTPTKLWKGPSERGWGESGSEHFMTRVGLPPGSRIAYLWGHHLDPTVRAGWRDRLTDHLQATRWYDCFRLDDDVLAAYHLDLKRWRPRGMIAYAGALGALADAVLATGDAPPNYPRTAFVTGAEKLYRHQRDAIESAFSRPVHEQYGSRDVGLMGFQLDPSRNLDFTVDWAKLIVEPDRTISAEDPTAGILVTKLRADGMPMLRYRVGDVAHFPADSRPGTPTYTLHEIVGRDMDRLWMPDGRWMHPAVLPHLMKGLPIRDFQLHQHADYRVTVRIVADAGFGEDARAAILGIIRANLPRLDVSVEEVAEIPRSAASKWRPVTSDVAARDRRISW